MSVHQCRKCNCTDIQQSDVDTVWPPRVKFTCLKCGFWWTAPSPEAMDKQIKAWRNQEEGR